jgi:GT2 family glycosyltransferase
MSHLTTATPLCTVVVPAYNCARTLAQTLASATSQTVTDIEIIAIDDGSSDSTAALLRQIAANDPRVSIIHQKNTGVSAARNAGIVRARSEIIACLDADDLWPSHHLATHLQRLSSTVDLDLSFSVARFIDAEGTVLGLTRPKLTALTAVDVVRSNPTTTCSTWVVRKRLFARVGLFDRRLNRSEDQAWLLRAALAGALIKGTAESIVSYRTATTGLASDLDGMRAGFIAMLQGLATEAPTFLARHQRMALACEDKYLARQALRLGLPLSVARKHIVNALRHAPDLIWRQPRSTLGVLAAVVLPQITKSGAPARPQTTVSEA